MAATLQLAADGQRIEIPNDRETTGRIREVRLQSSRLPRPFAHFLLGKREISSKKSLASPPRQTAGQLIVRGAVLTLDQGRRTQRYSPAEALDSLCCSCRRSGAAISNPHHASVLLCSGGAYRKAIKGIIGPKLGSFARRQIQSMLSGADPCSWASRHRCSQQLSLPHGAAGCRKLFAKYRGLSGSGKIPVCFRR